MSQVTGSNSLIGDKRVSNFNHQAPMTAMGPGAMDQENTLVPTVTEHKCLQ